MSVLGVVVLTVGALLLGMALCAVYYFKFGGNGYDKLY